MIPGSNPIRQAVLASVPLLLVAGAILLWAVRGVSGHTWGCVRSHGWRRAARQRGTRAPQPTCKVRGASKGWGIPVGSLDDSLWFSWYPHCQGQQGFQNVYCVSCALCTVEYACDCIQMSKSGPCGVSLTHSVLRGFDLLTSLKFREVMYVRNAFVCPCLL